MASGATGASPIWNRLMREITAGHKDQAFPIPGNIVSLNIDAFGGGLPIDGRPARSEYFIKGTEPSGPSPIYKKLKISKNDSGKLANPLEIATGQYEEKDFIVFEEKDPTGSDPNRWQEGIDKWLESQSDPQYHPPKDTAEGDENNVIVNIKNPQDWQRINSNNPEISAEAKALRTVTRLEIYVDGDMKAQEIGKSISKNISIADGLHKIKIKAYTEGNHSGEREITVGINQDAIDPTVTVQPSNTPPVSPTVS